MIEISAFFDFLEQHRLPDSYVPVIEQNVIPIAQALAENRNQRDDTLLVGINGSQGSGKTTLGDALVVAFKELGLEAVAISIDDFYLTKQAREHLAQQVHPLLKTRGVPGTHDTVLANLTLDQLTSAQGEVAIPRFDKSVDDRLPMEQWDRCQAPVDVVILEGWCVGAKPQPDDKLAEPCNPLEELEDTAGQWRGYANDNLKHSYADLFGRFDAQIMLKAPSFECVFKWRLEQENKLREKVGNQGEGLMSGEQISRFIQHYQRITENNLQALPSQVHFLLTLDQERRITQFSRPVPL